MDGGGFMMLRAFGGRKCEYMKLMNIYSMS